VQYVSAAEGAEGRARWEPMTLEYVGSVASVMLAKTRGHQDSSGGGHRHHDRKVARHHHHHGHHPGR